MATAAAATMSAAADPTGMQSSPFVAPPLLSRLLAILTLPPVLALLHEVADLGVAQEASGPRHLIDQLDQAALRSFHGSAATDSVDQQQLALTLRRLHATRILNLIGKLRGTHEELVDRGRARAAFGDRPHDEALTAAHVATDEHVREIRTEAIVP